MFGIKDIIAIDDTHYLLVAYGGLLKTTKDQLIKHYHKWREVQSLCHFADSIYFVAFGYEHNIVVWDEQQDQQLWKIFIPMMLSIKRVMTTKNFIIKSNRTVCLLTIDDLNPTKLLLSWKYMFDA